MYVHCRAVGNKMYGTQYYDQIAETVRKAAEYCDSLQSFFIIHSMGGGKEGWKGEEEKEKEEGGKRDKSTCYQYQFLRVVKLVSFPSNFCIDLFIGNSKKSEVSTRALIEVVLLPILP